MAIEKSLIEQRIVDLKTQLEQLKANINAVAGAIQFAEALLTEEPLKEENKENGN